jgi:preprotein translocase subunit SecD
MKRLKTWLWLCLGVVLAAVAAFLLWPTADWYLAASAEQREAAIGPLDGMEAFAERETAEDIAALLAADPGEAIPRPFRYLVPLAAGHSGKLTDLPAARWRLGDLLGEYPDRSLLVSDICRHHQARLESLRDRSRRVIRIPRDRGDGVRLVLKADFEDLERSTGVHLDTAGRQAILEKAMKILQGRAREMLGAHAAVNLAGADQIQLRIPGTRDLDRVRSIATILGRLTFHLADTDSLALVREHFVSDGGQPFDEEGNVLDTAVLDVLPAGTVIRGVFTRDEYGIERYKGYAVVIEKPGLDGTAIRDTAVSLDKYTGRPVVNFRLTAEGGEAFYRLTSANIGKVLAIIYDDRIKAQATVSSAIRDAVTVQGFSEDEARELALLLRTGSLPVRLAVVEERVLEPATE